jgi:hypothetical protein
LKVLRLVRRQRELKVKLRAKPRPRLRPELLRLRLKLKKRRSNPAGKTKLQKPITNPLLNIEKGVLFLRITDISKTDIPLPG